jgi:outer membrane protein OmpA-like peptidoglycan-associated protein
LKLSPLGVGKYQLELDTADDAGNVSNVSVADAIIIAAKSVSPTVEKYVGNNPSPTINGTYDKDNGRSLSVAVGGRSYLLGTDSNLTADQPGRWSLAIAAPLKDGYYDVVATTTDASGETTKDLTVAEVAIDTTGPAAPTVDNASALPVTGTFAAADTKRLRVTLAGKAYTLGDGKELSADGDKWKLAPLEKLDPGTYDVAVAAADQFGNLTLDATRNEITIAATVEPPTVNVSEQTVARPAVSGTWPEGLAKSLKVSLAGRQYVLATDAELTSAAGVWMLKVTGPLKDGVYDVVAEIAGPDGKILTDATKDELTVDAAGPPIPTVALYSSDSSPSSIAGTWGEGDALSLVVSLAGKTATLGPDKVLSSDGKGNWSLAVGDALKPGSYDVGVTTTDKRGRVATDQTRYEILVKEGKTKEPPSPPVEMQAPTIDGGEQLIARPAITGTWSEGAAKTLKVSLAGKTYVLGTDDMLKSSGGRWTLALQTPLRDGIYDVAVETADEAGKILTDKTKDELIVDAAGPATPTVNLYSSESSPSSISGTWAEGDAVSLAVMLAGKTATLGADHALSSDGKGVWTLAVSDILKSGSYDVAVTTADKRGRIASDQTRFEILVKEPIGTPPPKVDCDFEFSKTLIVMPIHFDSDKSAVPADASATIRKLAGIAGECAEGNLEIGGHTDVIGSDAYNQALSERRAVAVMKAMIAQGVRAGRLQAMGYGETMPLATNETEQGRAVNRRIELKIVK